jgi:hypothetical protein
VESKIKPHAELYSAVGPVAKAAAAGIGLAESVGAEVADGHALGCEVKQVADLHSYTEVIGPVAARLKGNGAVQAKADIRGAGTAAEVSRNDRR